MKNLLVTVALVLVAFPSSAAIQYEFSQKNTSDDGVSPSKDMTGRATIDGERSRIEFLSGNMYPPGTYVVSTDGSRRLFFVDPAKEWYTEVNTAGIATAIGASNIKIENLKSKVDTLPERMKIAGVEAEHHRISLTYDITVMMKTIPLKQHVRTDIDTWTTNRFVGTATFLSSAMRTGNPAVDQLLEAENAKITGFPLRQVVTIRTNFELTHKSNLNRPTSRTMTRETWVTSIREVTAEASHFVFPARYRRADQPDVPKATTQTLTFDPPSK
jgi:hypothetical protein